MFYRISVVNNLSVGAAVTSAMVSIGDTKYIFSRREFLAVTRYEDIFLGSEGNTMKQYDTYSKQHETEPIYEQLSMSFFHANPYIKAGDISILGTTNGTVHIGSGDLISARGANLTIRQVKE